MKFAFSAFAVAASLAHGVSACTTGVTDFTLIDAETDTEIAPLEGFDFLTLDLSSASLNIRANVQECSGDKIDSIRFFMMVKKDAVRSTRPIPGSEMKIPMGLIWAILVHSTAPRSSQDAMC